jgi:alkylated DNA repair dioxygenase AlkB
METQAKLPGLEGYPLGFRLIPDIISKDEEEKLLLAFEDLGFKEFEFHEWKAKRRSVDFGWDYSFDDASISRAPDIPEFLLRTRERLAQCVEISAHEFEEVSILEYPAGSGIGWHRDVLAFDVVVGISLLSPATLRLRPWKSKKRSRKDIIAVTLPPRSLYLLSGSARYDWQHSVPPVGSLRYVITMRTFAAKKSN